MRTQMDHKFARERKRGCKIQRDSLRNMRLEFLAGRTGDEDTDESQVCWREEKRL